MAKADPISEKTVRDSRSGRFVTVHGVGALKGKLTIDRKVDLTKPIAAQAMKGSAAGRSTATPKR